MAIIKSLEDQKKIRVAGKMLANVLQRAFDACEIGMTDTQLDEIIHKDILSLGSTPSFIGYDGYPAASCISINDQVVHGIPNGRVFKEGDLIGIDVGLWHQGVCTDSAVTKVLGTATTEVDRLISATKEALKAGIKAAKPYRRVGSISAAVQAVADREGLGIVRALTGHGVGHAVHESPDVPNYGRIGDGALLKPGMVIAIEPMFTLGGGDVETQVDGWGIVSSDGSLAAHFEHTVIITAKKAEVTTSCPANSTCS